jgi:hypothetical protein
LLGQDEPKALWKHAPHLCFVQLRGFCSQKHLYHNQKHDRRGQRVDRVLQLDRFQEWGMGLLGVNFLLRLVGIIARFRPLRFLIDSPSRLKDQ